MYCKKCGTEQRNGHVFCPKCGTPFSAAQSQTGGSAGNPEEMIQNNNVNSEDYTDSNILLWISIIGIVLYSIFIYINNDEDDIPYHVLFCLIARINPICVITKKNENLDFTTGIIVSALLCVITTIVGIVTKDETSGPFFTDFLKALTSRPYQFVYLFLVIIANVTSKIKELCLYSTFALIGLFVPIFFVMIFYIVMIVVGLVIGVIVCVISYIWKKDDKKYQR